MSETGALQAIRLALGLLPDLRLFRNNVGMLKDLQGRPVRFGLHPGSSDLIGWRSVVITPDMVGQRVAIFTALEVKAPGGTHKVTAEQRQFLDIVEAAGGIGGVARSPDQALLALGLHPTERAA
jgi:hypothetical protein